MPKHMRTTLIAALSLAALGGSVFARTLMPYFGLIASENATIYVTNSLTDFTCTVQITLVDTQGMTIAQGDSVMVGPGQSTSFTGLGTVLGSPGRTELRPVITFHPPQPCKPAALVSAEVTDSTGAVRVFHPPSPCIGGPAVPVRSGLIDLLSGQTARVIVVNLIPPGPTEFPAEMLMVRFLDPAGAVLSAKTFSVNPGAAAISDFTAPPATTPLAATLRYEVSLVSPAAPVEPFSASSEIFDATGATTVAHPPNPCLTDNAD